jgi:hypothetical protein
MANDSLLNTPVLWINKYLEANIPLLTNIEVPLFPSTPSILDDLTGSFPAGGVMGTWDRLIKMNRKSMPHIKAEQILYYFYATAENTIVNMVQIQESVFRLMDRLDETAEEINNWCSNRVINVGTEGVPDLIENMFYFHNFKVYQLEETRDIIDFGTARTYGGNKMIIDFEYHQMPDLNSNNWTRESLPTSGQGYSITTINGKTKRIVI